MLVSSVAAKGGGLRFRGEKKSGKNTSLCRNRTIKRGTTRLPLLPPREGENASSTIIMEKGTGAVPGTEKIGLRTSTREGVDTAAEVERKRAKGPSAASGGGNPSKLARRKARLFANGGLQPCSRWEGVSVSARHHKGTRNTALFTPQRGISAYLYLMEKEKGKGEEHRGASEAIERVRSQIYSRMI